MENELLQIKDEALEKIEACTSLKELNDIRVLYLGKKGPIQEAMKSMKNMDPDQRKQVIKLNKNYLKQLKIKKKF